MGYDYTVIQVVCWVELLDRAKETLPNFCENMDLDKWDTTVWYRATRIWGVTAWYQSLG